MRVPLGRWLNTVVQRTSETYKADARRLVRVGMRGAEIRLDVCHCGVNKCPNGAAWKFLHADRPQFDRAIAQKDAWPYDTGNQGHWAWEDAELVDLSEPLQRSGATSDDVLADVSKQAPPLLCRQAAHSDCASMEEQL